VNKPNLKIIETEDGSHSVYREDLKETYHSFHGAKGESQHVFIEYGLSTIEKPKINVFEVGMGTGLNVFLTALEAARRGVSIRYDTIEPIPLDKRLYGALNYGRKEEELNLLQLIHSSAWDIPVKITAHFEFTKQKKTLESVALEENHFDIVYFDAFAPSKQPELWSLDNLKKCYNSLIAGGILTTYCAQGQFKRNLKSIGFEVESLPGAMGKKEMVRARKPC
jgi:tRNA U34 5-methylaminomethyl-2-thiouridine-forming methyltransferase MnmC